MVGQTYQQVKRSREKRKKKGEVNKTKGKKERRKGWRRQNRKGRGVGETKGSTMLELNPVHWYIL